MENRYDFETVFKLLDQMEACLDEVRQLNALLDESLRTIPQAA
ncbi:hypothetical protein [Enterobacter cloacae]|nr:hypothetical protein [Enterobacter cloacae]